MRGEAVAFILTVVAPPIFVHFSLLASAQEMDRSGGRGLNLANLRRLNILLPHLFALLWGLTAYALARYGEGIIATMADKVYECMRNLYLTGGTGDVLHPPRVAGYVVITFLSSQWLLSILGGRRYPRGKAVGYFEVLLIWLIPALIYWIGTGTYIYRALARYRPLYDLCGVYRF